MQIYCIARAIKLMSESPLIDTHVDLPQIIRGLGLYLHDKSKLNMIPSLYQPR